MPGYAIVTISLKPIGGMPGDATAEQMDAVADLAERYCLDEVRVSHEQNLVLPHVRARRSAGGLRRAGDVGPGRRPMPAWSPTSSPAPGLDYCALANARSIPIAQRDLRALRRRRSGSARSAS